MSTAATDPNDFLLSSAVPSAKFAEIGATVRGTIIAAEVQQQRDFVTGEPKTYDNGDPMMQLVITLATDDRDPAIDGDDGTRKLYAKGQMLAAIRQAVRSAGARLEPGGTLAVKYVADKPAEKRGFNPSKQYEAAYKPGAPKQQQVDSLLGDPETASTRTTAADLL